MMVAFMFSRSIDKTFYNKDGSTSINVLESNINSTVLEVSIDDYQLNEIFDSKYLVGIDKGIPRRTECSEFKYLNYYTRLCLYERIHY